MKDKVDNDDCEKGGALIIILIIFIYRCSEKENK